jgi:prepilin-type N-terminal cleavage/methylation domain-containing protein
MSALSRRWNAADREADAGFGMVEMMVSLVIIAIVTTAALSFFLNGLSSENGQRQRQEAIYLADQQMQTVQAVPAADLVQGRTSAAQTAALTTPIAGTLNLAAQSDTSAGAGFDSNASDSVLIPLSQTQSVNNVTYTLWTFVYACHLLVSSDSQCGQSAPADSTPELRATVAVTWTSHAHCQSGCNYSTSTLVDPSGDQTFNTNISSPTITNVAPATFFNTNTGTRGVGSPPPPYETCTTGPVGNTVTAPGTLMVITGTGFKSNIRVLISGVGGSIPTNAIYQPSATEVDLCLQTGDTPGAYTISVINNDGGHIQTTINEVPVIRWVALTGSGANQTLTMNGGGFLTGATFTATGGVSGNFTVVSKTQATLTQYVGPSAGASPAPLLTITDPSPASQQASFTLPAMAAATSPSAVAVGRVVPVAVTGTGFKTGLGTALVTNGTATVTASTATTATVNIQAVAVGTMSFALLNADGGVSNTISLVVDPLPTVVAPGSKVIGTTWTINGTGFLPGMTASISGGGAVVVNSQTGTTAASLTIVGGSTGSQTLTLTNTDGGTVTTPITVLPLPAVTSSTTGVSGQVAVNLSGTNFQSTMTVTDANGTATIVSRSGTTGITVMLTGAAGSHTLTLTNPDGGVTTRVVTVDAPLDITSVETPVGAGSVVTITGTGFASGLTASSSKGGVSGVTVVNSTTVNITLSATGSNLITLTNSDGGSDSATVVVNAAPNITSLTLAPTAPTHNGTVAVTVAGTGFQSGATFTAQWTRTSTATTNPTPTSVVFVSSTKETFNLVVPPTTSASGSGAKWTLTVTINNPDGGTDNLAKTGITVS